MSAYRDFCIILMASILALIGCASTRSAASDFPRTESHAISPNEDTALRRIIAPIAAQHHGQSGFHLIVRGEDALLTRIAMLNAAERSVDIQYYTFQDDETGKLLLEAILRAADRGVRVRILIDSISVEKSDPTWALLDTHPHIELRVFNPLTTRDQSLIGRINDLLDFEHYTRRMHNKVFIADNQLAVTGGRNLGDAYFDSSQDFNFRDIDVLAAGPIAADISHSFDSYWNGEEAFPIDAVTSVEKNAEAMHDLRQALQAHWQEAAEKGILLHPPSLDAQLQDGATPLVWANAEVAADSPKKIEQPSDKTHSRPESQLATLASQTQHEFLIISPYFVPGDQGVSWLKGIADRGVKISILTNSLASTDVVAVHTGYRHYRTDLLEDGMSLYEMKPLPGRHPRPGRFSSSSRASLHSKLYIFDRRDLIIGTMNLDPRSARLNTEIVLAIHSPALAARVAEIFDHAIQPTSSYHLVMNNGNIEWITEEDGKKVVYDTEPRAGFWREIKAGFYGLLPIEDQL